MKVESLFNKMTGGLAVFTAVFTAVITALGLAMAFTVSYAKADDTPAVYGAPLTGWSESAGVDGLSQGLADEYGVTVTANTSDDYIDYDLVLTAKNLQYHVNGNGTYGYWIGLSMPDSYGCYFYLFNEYTSGTDYASDTDNAYASLINEDCYNIITLDDVYYDAFYFGVKKLNTQYDWVIVQNDGTENTVYHLTYTVVPKTYSVSYLDMDGSAMMPDTGDTSYYAGYPDDWSAAGAYTNALISFTLPTPTRTDCTFLGWTLKGGDDTLYEAGSTFTKTVDASTNSSFGGYTFVANWEINTNFTYTMDSTGGVTITGYTGDVEEIIIPSTLGGFDVKAVAEKAFYGNTALKRLYFIGDLESIRDSAFEGCTSLASVKALGNVGEIGDKAFCGCTALTEFTAAATGIGDFAFNGCSALAALELSGEIDEIGELPFYGCEELSDITLSGYISEITADTFYGCNDIKTITISGGVGTIGAKAFFGRENLTALNISGYVTTIEDYAFCDCTSLKSLTIGNGTVTIGANAFRGCEKVKTISLPDSVTILGKRAFAGCTAVTQVKLGKGLKTLGTGAFKDCTKISKVNICCTVTKAVGQAFADAKSYSVNIASSGKIAKQAYKDATNLKSVTLGANITAIDKAAFKGCTKLKTFKCNSKKLKTVAKNAFKGDTKLKKIYVKTAKAKKLFNKAVKKAGIKAKVVKK